MWVIKQGQQFLSVLGAVCACLFVLSAKADVNPTFDKVCKSCHTGGFKGWVSGAPNIQEKDDWAIYIKRDSLDQMRNIVLQGSDDHKVKGGCKKCSDEAILGAIDYMLFQVNNIGR